MNNRKNPASDMLAVGGYFLLMITASLAAVLLATIYFYAFNGTDARLAEDLDTFLTQNGMVMTAASNILVLISIFVTGRVRKRGFLAQSRLRSRPKPTALILCALAGLAANIWFSFVLNSGVVPQSILDDYGAAYQAAATGALPLELLTLIILAPLVEEIIFRGIILGHLKNLVPTGAAIIFQALLFGCIHGDLLWVAYASVLGCVIGLIRVRCSSVWAGIVFHMAFNGASYLFLVLADAVWDTALLRSAMFLVSAAVFLVCMWRICAPKKLVK